MVEFEELGVQILKIHENVFKIVGAKKFSKCTHAWLYLLQQSVVTYIQYETSI